jgi:hypothetical protein
MNMTVKTLLKNGRRYHRGNRGFHQSVDGDLNLSFDQSPIDHQLGTNVACIINEDGISLVPDLLNAKCISISASGIRLRGTSIGLDGAEYAQEWFCTVNPQLRLGLKK